MPAEIPSRVRQVVALCLRKDVRQRISDIRDVRLALEGAFDTTSGLSPATTAPRSARLRLGALAIVAAMALVAAAALAFVHFREAPAERRSVSFQFPAPEKSVIATFDLSPDGRYVAFVTRGESSKLWVRPIESLDAQELPGTDGARPAAGQVFWSPDSSFIGFVADGKLKKVSISGGPPQTLTDVLDSARGTWGQQGVILIAPGPGAPIRRLPEAGGVSVAVTAPGAGENHFTPIFCPTVAISCIGCPVNLRPPGYTSVHCRRVRSLSGSSRTMPRLGSPRPTPMARVGICSSSGKGP